MFQDFTILLFTQSKAHEQSLAGSTRLPIYKANESQKSRHAKTVKRRIAANTPKIPRKKSLKNKEDPDEKENL